tara:strand:- start:491 stop:676 length:186 start_codon:yes stop_codon:yes gene_type:complete
VENAALRSVRRLGITAAVDARLVCCCGRHAANNAARAEGSRVIAPSPVAVGTVVGPSNGFL